MKSRSVVVVFALALVGCGSRGKEDRAKVLETLSLEVMLPSHRELADSGEPLQGAMGAYCQSPDAARLDTVRSAWRSTRRAYRRTAAFQFGPVEDQRFAQAIDFWPVREADVEKAIAAAPLVTDATYLGTLGVSARGLPALEYLLFATDASTSLGAADDTARRRCNYASALAADIATRSRQIFDLWDGSDGYAHDLARAGEGDSSIATTQAGVDLVLNGTTRVMVELTDNALSKPLGKTSGGVPEPESVESRYSGDAVADYDAALTSLRRVWVGALEGERGKGMTLLVRRTNESVDDRVRAQIELTGDRASAIPAPLDAAVVSNPASVEDALTSARDLRRLFATEVLQAIGGTLTFSDNDGD